MKTKDSRLLEGLQVEEPLAEFYRRGGTPELARFGAETLVGPYFQHRNRLSDIPMEYLFPCARGIAKIIRDGFEVTFDELLKIYRSAHRLDPSQSLQLVLEDQQSIQQALAVFWSLFHLDRERKSLDLDEFLHETLRNIGAILEGLVKPMVLALSRQVLLATGAPSGIDQLSFGQALDLIERAGVPQGIFEIRGVRVNQWRNIAQHLSARVQDEHIVCRYGTADQHVTRLQREQLDSVLRSCMHLYERLKTAHEVFFFDHWHDMREAGLLPFASTPKQRPEADLMVLLGGIVSQGFAVIEISQTTKWSSLVVQDVSTMSSDARRIHASQFVVSLASFRPAPMLSVEYRERDGTRSLLTIAPMELIERATAVGDLALVAAEATFVDLKVTSPEDVAKLCRTDDPSAAELGR